jgi:hypothetical protein
MSFGLLKNPDGSEKDITTYINDAIARLPKLNGNDARQVMYDMYDKEFGIFDHFSTELRPLSSIGIHYPESPDALISVSDYIDAYIDRELHAHGISFEAYMNMPSHVVRRIIDKVASKEAKKTSDLNNTLGLDPKQKK